MKYIIIILFLIASFFKVPEQNGWAFRQFACFGVLSIVISWMLSKKYHISVGICFLITALYGFLTCGLPQFGSEVVSSLMVLCLFSCIVLGTKDFILNSILPILSLIAIVDSIIMIIEGLIHYSEPWGFMQSSWVLTNASLDACFLALMFPIIWIIGKKLIYQIPSACLILLAISLARSNTAFLVLLITSLSILPKKILLLAPISYFAMGNKFAQNMGRFGNWKIMMTLWYEKANHWVGTGPGTYWIISQQQQAHKIGDQVFGWMHNDFLQVLFEQGIIGLVAILFLYFSMIWKSHKKPVLLSMVLGYGVVAMTLYPLHLFFFQLIGVALIYLCFEKRDYAPVLQ